MGLLEIKAQVFCYQDGLDQTHPHHLQPHPHPHEAVRAGWNRVGFRGSNGAVARQPIFKPRSCKLLTLAQIDIDSNWANIHRADGKIRRKSACRR